MISPMYSKRRGSEVVTASVPRGKRIETVRQSAKKKHLLKELFRKLRPGVFGGGENDDSSSSQFGGVPLWDGSSSGAQLFKPSLVSHPAISEVSQGGGV